MIIDELAHYGTPRHSGRYPWGSGGDEVARSRDFLGYVAKLQKEGMAEADIAVAVGLKNTTELRARKTIALNARKQADIAMAVRLKEKGLSNSAIAKRMGLAGESTVRSYLAASERENNNVLKSVSDMLREQVNEKGIIDIGVGVEHYAGVARNMFQNAVALLRSEGYNVHYIPMPQLGTNHKTTIKVLTKPDIDFSAANKARDDIKSIQEFSRDGGRTFLGIKPPVSIKSSRVAVNYAETGGADADGTIYIRPGVKDVSIGDNRYAQVRVAVDGTHFLKGMAVYKDDLPPGVDLMFNTNKSDTGNKLDAMKPLKRTKDGEVDLDNPFGSNIRRQLIEVDSKGNERVTSVMNMVNEEGTWATWSKSLSSQVLSKQSPAMAKQQLDMKYEQQKSQMDEYMALTNPVIRRKLLSAHAESMDATAVQLNAAAMPRTANSVILPIASMKDTEVYAPAFKNGERVVLIRHPHGGKFEIPELTVNNRNPEARRVIGENAQDAIGINSKVAERLSGADFDGDTVLVIPNNKGSIKTQSPLAGLQNFNPRTQYAKYDGMPVMSPRTKQREMGDISNLITDMTIRKANADELARAVRHSMVVIDAEKHELNYKQSAIDNNIIQLKQKYQGKGNGGASTLISKAGSQIRVPTRKPNFEVDKETGKKIYTPTGETYVDPKTGKTVPRTFISEKLAETDDAYTLSSGTPIEKIYADHSNRLKGLANQARKESVNTKNIPYSPSANKAYAKEVGDLTAKLNVALKNAPRERQAQVLGNAVIAAKKRAYPDMDAETEKKMKFQALEEARSRMGAKKALVHITDKEWEAIQAGALSNDRLTKVIDNADLDRVKELATPRTRLLMTSTKKARAASMLASGYTQAEVAEALGVSLTTLKNNL